MNPAGSDSLSWSRSRWWVAVLFVTVVQAGLIFGLSDRKPIVPRQPGFFATVHLVTEAPPGSAIGEWLSLEDPTLLALPDPRGFSGSAWMTVPTLLHQAQDWTEPPRWLALPVAGLGATFAEFVRTNSLGPRLLADKPQPPLSEVALSRLPLPATSTIRLEGDLAGREVLTLLEVPSISHTDILTNTVVQVVVDSRGFVFSPPVVIGASGSKTADQRALELLKSIRFKPVAPIRSDAARDPSALTWGKIIFQWRTLELPATNRPAAGLPP
jgi:hypothetical protein